MPRSSNTLDVYLEIGKKRTIASAIDWPGWARVGRDEQAALDALVAYGPRYAKLLHGTKLTFHTPADASALSVVERLEGNATTDFGAPDIAPAYDEAPIDDAALQRFETLLRAYWQAFDSAVSAAHGKELRKGPRGGGRDLDNIVWHVVRSDRGYLGRLAWKREQPEAEDLAVERDRTRQAVLDALAAAARGETPERGPRGGVLWRPRYFVRRVAWHVIDHIWEIEDRMI